MRKQKGLSIVNRTLPALCFFLFCWAATARPAEPVEHELVNIAALPNPPLLDVRYATVFNFTKDQLYPGPVVFLHRDAARALEKASAALREKGFALRVFDGYRPLHVQQKMWDIVRDERYVSNPAVNRGRHTRGTAVDVSLADLMGNPVPMPSGFDDFTERAHRDFGGSTPEEKANSKLLEEVMRAHGFVGYPTEWWHFDLADWKTYPVLDISIKELLEGRRTAIPVD